MFKKARIALFVLFALCASMACSSSGSPVTTYLTLALPLQLSSQLNNVSDNLGSGDFSTPIGFNLQSLAAIYDMVDGLFTFLNDSSIPTGSTQVAVTTDQGVLKADFLSISSATVDFDQDGTKEEVSCSRSTELPICAYLWIDDAPLGLLVLVNQAADGNVGQGTLSFIPSRVGLSGGTTEAAVTWNGTTARDAVQAYYVGASSSDVTATKASGRLHRDRGVDSTAFNVWQSGEWTQNPITPCTASEAIFGWVDESAYISTKFHQMGTCALPIADPACVDIATAAVAPLPGSCTVNIAAESYMDVNSFDASDAQLPADFPDTPTF